MYAPPKSKQIINDVLVHSMFLSHDTFQGWTHSSTKPQWEDGNLWGAELRQELDFWQYMDVVLAIGVVLLLVAMPSTLWKLGSFHHHHHFVVDVGVPQTTGS